MIVESESNIRNRLLLETLHLTGLRVSELAGLTWRDVIPRQDLGAAQVRVRGKGNRERNVPFPLVHMSNSGSLMKRFCSRSRHVQIHPSLRAKRSNLNEAARGRSEDFTAEAQSSQSSEEVRPIPGLSSLLLRGFARE